MLYVKQIETTILNVFEAVGTSISKDSLTVDDLGIPHEPKNLPKNKMAVYMYIYGDCFIKIGQAYKNSNARFQYQHYNGHAGSGSLCYDIINDPGMKKYGLNMENVSEWMKANLRRIDILIDAELGKLALNLVEACMHYIYNPKYEGKRTR